MKKPYILFISILISVSFFLLLARIFMGVSTYLADKYKPNYITPTAKDSTYMELLMDQSKRQTAMNLSRELHTFYNLTDSIKTILDAEISPELISSILLEKGMADTLRMELLRFDQDSIITCVPPCMDIRFLEKKNWDSFFQETAPREIRSYIEQKIEAIEEAEHRKLLEF